MSDVKKCDRCGCIYEENIKCKAIDIRGCVIAGIATYTREAFIDKTFDLCDDCIKEFVEKFMKGVQFVEVPQPESDN